MSLETSTELRPRVHPASRGGGRGFCWSSQRFKVTSTPSTQKHKFAPEIFLRRGAGAPFAGITPRRIYLLDVVDVMDVVRKSQKTSGLSHVQGLTNFYTAGGRNGRKSQ